MYRPRAWIITIGNELLIGRTVNTNAATIARELTLRGVLVKRIVVVGDSIDEIATAVREALGSADIVVTTGGLGPTDDDMTMEAVAAAIDEPLVLNPEALEMVKKFYGEKGLPLTRERIKMAYLPRGAEPLPNPVGAAPGAYIIYSGSHIIMLPGVPAEMEAMLQEALKKLKPFLPRLCVVEEGITIRGVPESTLAPLLRRAAKSCSDCYVKSHPKGHEVREPVVEVKVLASAPNCETAKSRVRNMLGKLEALLNATHSPGKRGL
ncbi:damage-inducible protein CinA [Pyrodictium occultum]|uniref:Damage-inducible protein CinA n=1 Tax=Pyrodictium occultum TaxID=2309 RepID=A0A0V8RWG4_PYROC|nr:nicotinamide mononucleotide deamidase-related protein [Pyrodictium occultum]KSW12314.1 damage-inducible protein CinA [Pyrodictium occultum]